MRVFEYNIRFNCWGEIYAGLRKQYLNWEQIAWYIKEGRTLFHWDPKRIDELTGAAESHLSDKFELIARYIEEDDGITIHPVENIDSTNYLPRDYFKIWILEVMLRIDALYWWSPREKLREAYYSVFIASGHNIDILGIVLDSDDYKDKAVKETHQRWKKYIEVQIKELLDMNTRYILKNDR